MTKYNWDEISKDFGKLSDQQIADKHGVDGYRLVSNYRHRTGVANTSKFSNYMDYIGKIPDKDAALALGITPNAVTRYRLRHGIHSDRTNNEQLFQYYVAGITNGKTEHFIDHYRIDILTDTKIIECKLSLNRISLFMAIAQLFIYRDALGDNRSMAIAYATIDEASCNGYLKSCVRLGIELLHYPDFHNPVDPG